MNAFLTPRSNVFSLFLLFKPPFNYTSFDSWGGWRPTKEFPLQPVSQWVSSLSASHLSSGSVGRDTAAACGYMEVILKHTATFHQQSNSPFQTKSRSHYYSMTRYGPDATFTQPIFSQLALCAVRWVSYCGYPPGSLVHLVPSAHGLIQAGCRQRPAQKVRIGMAADANDINNGLWQKDNY